MAWIFAALILMIWFVHRGGSNGSQPDAGGLTSGQKAMLIAARNKAADALKAAGATGIVLDHWTEIRLTPQNTYITVFSDGSSDWVHYTAASVRAEVCHYTTTAADFVDDASLIYC